ncbi:hypothetical protein FSP39_007194 [Pinctada imbricata]|uniref:Tripartite motif-containing protein 2 n=1 Tax=Pinctada imbricata TaxID=66713 RepID=A0AA88YJ81_PINIB|nr:hypothetical protein FSP39_007194 [Pinctada imbricata]
MIDNDIVYTLFSSKIIRRVTPSGTESDICSTTPLHPVGICKSYNDGLMVTLCSCDTPEITSDSYGEVHHIDTSGGIIKTYTHTQDRKRKLFINPSRIAQNKNTDLCVVEYIDREFRSRLVCVSMLSQVRYTYTGQPALTEMFSCNDIACDHHGRILLTDFDNHAVHLLREDGHFLQYVLTEQSPLWGPQCLGLYGNTLWVGCEKGVVRVYKYSDEKC